jgi:tetratricopeptide (TPR) repeat protein
MKTIITIITLVICLSVFSQEDPQSYYNKLSERLITANDSEKAELYYKLSNLFLDSTGNKALIFAQKSLKYAEAADNKEDIALANLQLASVFMNQSDWDKALEFLSAAEIDILSVQDPSLQHSIYNQFGVVYKFTGQLDLSLKYFGKSLNVARNNQNNRDIIFALNNIGTILIIQKKYDAALQVYKSAEQEWILSNNPRNQLAPIYNNIGYIYFVQENYESARNAWNKTINNLDKNADFQTYAVILNNLAELEIKTGNYEQAEKNIKEAESIHQKHNYRESQKNLYFTSYQLYYNIARYQEAISYLNKYISLKDSIYTEDLNNNVSKLKADYDFVKLENESIIKDNEIKRKSFLSNILLVVIISITAFIVLLFSILIKIKKLNLKLNSLNNLLKVKNDEIESNLQYAKLIQSAITQNKENTPNLTIFDKPKFGVGGDFFMKRKMENQSFFVLGDCTGHGTSGAILSVFAISIINKALSIKRQSRYCGLMN